MKKVQKRVLDENYPQNLSWAMGNNLVTVVKTELDEEEIEYIANTNRSDKEKESFVID